MMNVTHRRWMAPFLGAALILGCRSSSAENRDGSTPAPATAPGSSTEAGTASPVAETQAENAKAAPLQGELVYVTKVQAPFAILEGEVLAVTVAGNLPTPAWTLSGVEVTVDSGASRIQLTPRAKPPAEGVMSIQVLQPFEARAEVKGLALGSYGIQVRSKDQATPDPGRVDVLPKTTLVFARSRGGIAGLDRSYLVTTDQRGRATSSRASEPVEKRLDDAAFGELKTLVAQLGDQGRTAQSNRGADMRTHWIAWTTPQGLKLTIVDDGTLNESERAVLDRLGSAFSP
jgi:hypothetical protein